MKTTYVYDADLDCVRPKYGGNYFEEEKPTGPTVVSDDIGAGISGLRAMYRKDGKRFDSKSRYKADVKAHGLEIAGNDDMRGSAPPPVDYGQVVKDAWQQFDGNHNGMADRVRAEEQRSAWRRNNG